MYPLKASLKEKQEEVWTYPYCIRLILMVDLKVLLKTIRPIKTRSKKSCKELSIMKFQFTQ